jgi:hypothetical protein
MSRRSPLHAPNGRFFRAIARAHRLLRGTVVLSPLVTTLGLVGAAAFGHGCVVTNDPSFAATQTDCPPSFLLDEADPPVGKPFTIHTTDVTPQFVATVPLRSCALTKTYDAHVILDGRSIFLAKVVPSAEETRPASITVPFLGVAPGCHRVEFLASTAFEAGDARTPATPGDLAYIVWFIDVVDGSTGASSTLASCPP